MAQRRRFGGVDEMREALALDFATLAEGLAHRGFDAGDDLERRRIAARGLPHFAAPLLRVAAGLRLQVANAAQRLALRHQLAGIDYRGITQVAVLHYFVHQ